MTFRRNRIIEQEILDDQPPGRAAASLRDLVRINRYLGGHEVLRRMLRQVVNPDAPFRFLDIGAGSGDAAGIVRSIYPKAWTVSLDYRLHHVRHAPNERVVADAFQLPLRPASFDVVYCSLFLHHFEDDQVVQLLAEMRRVSRAWVLVNDLERHFLPYHFLPATKSLFGWDPITLHDGPISVQAGFTLAEFRQLSARAGLTGAQVRAHRPAFRLSVIARAGDFASDPG